MEIIKKLSGYIVNKNAEARCEKQQLDVVVVELV